MKKIHYLILAHTLPHQLQRLVDRLDDDGVNFFIHVDGKAELTSFQSVIPQKNVFWCLDRIKCIWGDFSIVKATLQLMKEVEGSGAKEGICVLLSGQDYPIRDNGIIRQYLETHADCTHMDFHPADQVWHDFSVRTAYYKIQHSDRRLDYTLFHRWDLTTYLKLVLKGHLNPLLEKKLWQPRRSPFTFQYYGGSQWWAMPIAMLVKINTFVREHEKLLFGFFQDSLIPDEFFFQTIVGYLRDEGVDLCLMPPITYVRWDGKRNAQPVVFTSADLYELQSLPDHYLFARKFHFPPQS